MKKKKEAVMYRLITRELFLSLVKTRKLFSMFWLILLLLPGNKRENNCLKWSVVWNTSGLFHASGHQLLISWAPLDTHHSLLIFCLTHVLSNQPVIPGLFAHPHPLGGLGHCWTFTWPAVQHPDSWNTWKDFCKRTRKHLFVYKNV